ncbi:type II toxin-antitoxin system MqsA family antitoxin [Thiotrichales bacterium 19S9-12]|nr:type II toxin-antitoxin system MqsA family antitoxin [Thiotrichales bacterium 19S9-11]MCF6812488.1 type II toxin-antitoxin system MqsA family antitoxin [Thiotrichales bacterium 19S9-12]
MNFKKSLLKSAEEAVEIAQRKTKPARKHSFLVIDDIDVKKIREKLNISQSEFCERFGFKLRTLQKWEQQVSKPDTATRAYLMVIERNPQIVTETLKQGSD